MSGYVMMFVGIIFANVLLMFGMMMTPLLNKYEDDVINNKLAEYQYVLKAMQPTETQQHYPYLYLKKNSARNLIYRMVHLTDISPTKR